MGYARAIGLRKQRHWIPACAGMTIHFYLYCRLIRTRERCRGISIPTQTALNHGLRFSTDPDFALMIKANLHETIATDFAALAGAVA